MASVPNRQDPCWNDPAWRTDSLLALIAEFQLNSQELADYFNRALPVVLHWRSGKYKTIPVLPLRLLWLELALGGRNALR